MVVIIYAAVSVSIVEEVAGNEDPYARLDCVFAEETVVGVTVVCLYVPGFHWWDNWRLKTLCWWVWKQLSLIWFWLLLVNVHLRWLRLYRSSLLLHWCRSPTGCNQIVLHKICLPPAGLS